jgi:Mg2+ and Co2+ transporter CorA
MSRINVEHIENLAKQIDNATDCEVLLEIINTHVRAVNDLVKSLIATQLEILESILPLLKIPTSIRAIIRWIKKFVTGTILPQLRAYINMALQIIALIRALTTLANSITNARTKLEQCALETIPSVVNREINAAIRDLQSPLTNALNKIEIVQDQIEGVIGTPLSQRINTSSPEAFTASAETAFRSIESQLTFFVDTIDEEEEDDDPEPLDGEVPLSSGETLVIEDGLITAVLPPEGP